MPEETVYFFGDTASKYGGKDVWRQCLSQWYPCSFIGKKAVYNLDCILPEDWDEQIQNQEFNCCEQWMMGLKGLMFANGTNRVHNLAVVNKIWSTNSPKVMKKLGREIKGFNQAVWDQWKYKIVVVGNYLKFSQNKELSDNLKKTGNKLIVEASPFDAIWGIGFREDVAKKTSRSMWGQNLLGKALVEVRGLL